MNAYWKTWWMSNVLIWPGLFIMIMFKSQHTAGYTMWVIGMTIMWFSLVYDWMLKKEADKG